MTVREYIKVKNSILEKATGITLVPEDQIIDLEPMPLSLDHDGDACPYCLHFENCEKCPMKLAHNKCLSSISNTYKEITDQLPTKEIVYKGNSFYQELKYLIEIYNTSNGFKSIN